MEPASPLPASERPARLLADIRKLNPEARDFLCNGLAAIAVDDSRTALALLREAAKKHPLPVISSHLGYCMARVEGSTDQGIAHCLEAIKAEPERSVHYLNLGRIYLLADRKEDAIKVLRWGLSHEPDPEIMGELKRLGTRKTPPLPFFARSHPLNKYLGLLLARLGMR